MLVTIMMISVAVIMMIMLSVRGAKLETNGLVFLPPTTQWRHTVKAGKKVLKHTLALTVGDHANVCG